MKAIRRLEDLLYELHSERVRLQDGLCRDEAELDTLWQRIRLFEAELEARRQALGIGRRALNKEEN